MEGKWTDRKSVRWAQAGGLPLGITTHVGFSVLLGTPLSEIGRSSWTTRKIKREKNKYKNRKKTRDGSSVDAGVSR